VFTARAEQDFFVLDLSSRSTNSFIIPIAGRRGDPFDSAQGRLRGETRFRNSTLRIPGFPRNE
jgi:hypothetical protein